MLFRTLLLLFTFSLSQPVFSQKKEKPVKLTVIAPKLGAKYFLLANHFGNTKYKVDSILFNSNGEAIYNDDSAKIKGGIYLCIFPEKGNNYFEVILSGDEKNIIATIEGDEVQKPTFKNSEENKYFYEDIKYLLPYYTEMNKLKAEYDGAKNDKVKDAITNKIKSQEETLVNRRLNLINTQPNLFYSKVLNAMREVDVPDAPKKADGTIDSTFKYYYFKDHYWDYTDFNDDRLLYTPVFENKFDYYFDKLIIKHPDSIKKEMDFVLNKIKDPNSNMMRYCLATLLNDFANSKIMGQDEMYVYLVNNYYAKGKAPWTDSTSLKKMIYDAQDIEPVLIGKTAPNFAAFDTTLVNYSRLYDMNSEYKILVFWNPDCGHCKKEIPHLDSIYPDLLKEGCDIFSVSTVVDDGDNIRSWKKFIDDNKLRFKNYADPKHQMNPHFKILYKIKGTPEYFILDKNNKIIAKKLSPDQMVDFIQNHKKYKKN